MQFKVEKVSDWLCGENKEEFKEINTLEELMQLQQECGHSIILDGNTITIYDDYIE